MYDSARKCSMLLVSIQCTKNRMECVSTYPILRFNERWAREMEYYTCNKTSHTTKSGGVDMRKKWNFSHLHMCYFLLLHLLHWAKVRIMAPTFQPDSFEKNIHVRFTFACGYCSRHVYFLLLYLYICKFMTVTILDCNVYAYALGWPQY